MCDTISLPAGGAPPPTSVDTQSSAGARSAARVPAYHGRPESIGRVEGPGAEASLRPAPDSMGPRESA